MKRNGRVLHVAYDGGGCGAMARSLSACDAVVVRCADVYRAAAILGGDDATFDAVLVCVDCLSEAGYEFFVQANDAPAAVWIYTETDRRDAVRRAMERSRDSAVEVTPDDIASRLTGDAEVVVAEDAVVEEAIEDESPELDAVTPEPVLPSPSWDVYADDGPLLTREEIDSLILDEDEGIDSLGDRGVFAGGGEF